MWIVSRAEDEAKRAYTAEMLWQMYRVEYIMAGFRDFKYPRYMDVFEEYKKPQPKQRDVDITQSVAEGFMRIAQQGAVKK